MRTRVMHAFMHAVNKSSQGREPQAMYQWTKRNNLYRKALAGHILSVGHLCAHTTGTSGTKEAHVHVGTTVPDGTVENSTTLTG